MQKFFTQKQTKLPYEVYDPKSEFPTILPYSVGEFGYNHTYELIPETKKTKGRVLVETNQYIGITEEEINKDIDDDCMRVILASGSDRNVVVYDSQADQTISDRLISLMIMTNRRIANPNKSLNSNLQKYLTHFVVRKSDLSKVTQRDSIDFVGVSDEDMENYERFYLDKLKSSFFAGKNKLIIGLNLTDKNSLVMPVQKPVTKSQFSDYEAELGIAILDNQSVLLGCY